MIIAIWLITGLLFSILVRFFSPNSSGRMPLVVWIALIAFWPLLVVFIIIGFLCSIEI